MKVSEEQKESLKLPNTLRVVQEGKIRAGKNLPDTPFHKLLDAAKQELMKVPNALRSYAIEVFLRNLFFILSVQRQHNVWKEEGVKADAAGGQMRETGRSIVRWLYKNFTEWMFKRKDGYLYNLNLLVEYSNYDILLHNQIRTSKGSALRNSTLIHKENQGIPLDILAELIVQNIRKNKHLSLIARWLPKYSSGKYRYTKLVVGKDLKTTQFHTSDKIWVKHTSGGVVRTYSQNVTINLQEGDIIQYPRLITQAAKERMSKDNQLVNKVCKLIGWNIKQYREFRHKYMQLTPEHQFSTNKISQMTKDQFIKWVGSLSAGQQYVVSRRLCYIDDENLVVNPNGKWYNTELPKWYLEFKTSEEAKAQEIRDAMAEGNVEKAKAIGATMKTKTAGTQTSDLIVKLSSGKLTGKEVDTTFTSLTSKWDVTVPVYCCIDGSGSMTQVIDYKGVGVSVINLATVIATTFMLTNPDPVLGSSCIWYGSETEFVGETAYKNNAPNPFTVSNIVKTKVGKLIDRSLGFTENWRRVSFSNPGKVSSTNVGKVVESFLKLVQNQQMRVEDLPKVLVFITDDEGNQGMTPEEFMSLANSHGWNPLFVFWGLTSTGRLDQYKGKANILVERGFSENSLSTILQFIRKGSVNVYDSLFAVHENPAFSLIKYETK